MRKLIFASNNKHKLEEVKRIFDKYEILSLKDIGFTDEIVEDGINFQENALIKATTVHKFMKENTKYEYAVIADDSGLCVKAINYEPGVYSARYSGEGDEGNRKKLLSKLTTIQDRTAYFQCYVALILPDGSEYIEEGKTYGLITKEKIGDESFGYDCLFWSDEIRKTFGQATAEEKDKVSHRGKAMRKIADYLESINYIGIQDDEDEE